MRKVKSAPYDLAKMSHNKIKNNIPKIKENAKISILSFFNINQNPNQNINQNPINEKKNPLKKLLITSSSEFLSDVNNFEDNNLKNIEFQLFIYFIEFYINNQNKFNKENIYKKIYEFLIESFIKILIIYCAHHYNFNDIYLFYSQIYISNPSESESENNLVPLLIN